MHVWKPKVKFHVLVVNLHDGKPYQICKEILQCDILGMVFHHANSQPKHKILLWVFKHAKWVIFLNANLYYKISNLYGILNDAKCLQNEAFSLMQNCFKTCYFTFHFHRCKTWIKFDILHLGKCKVKFIVLHNSFCMPAK